MIFVIFKTKNIKQIKMCIANTPSGEFLDQLQVSPAKRQNRVTALWTLLKCALRILQYKIIYNYVFSIKQVGTNRSNGI